MSRGYLCDTEVNLCYSNPCGNNGTCKPHEGGYTCHCRTGFTGKPHAYMDLFIVSPVRMCPILHYKQLLSTCKNNAQHIYLLDKSLWLSVTVAIIKPAATVGRWHQAFYGYWIFYFLQEICVTGCRVLVGLCVESADSSGYWSRCWQLSQICNVIVFNVAIDSSNPRLL